MQNQLADSNQNTETTPEAKTNTISWWKLSTTIFLALFLFTLVLYFLNSIPNEPRLSEMTPTAHVTNDNLTAETIEHVITAYTDPSGFYKLYYTYDEKSFDTTVFIQTREIEPKTTKLLELRNFQGEFRDVHWSRSHGELSNQRLILKVVGPGDSVTDYLLSVDGSPAITLDLSYTLFKYYRVLAWVDEERILVEQSDIDEITGTSTITHWIAPVTNLAQRMVVEF